MLIILFLWRIGGAFVRWSNRTGRGGIYRTFRSRRPALNALKAVLELVLGGVKLRKRRRQVLEFFVELLLDLGKLLRL
jgi:hypothetical protein